ncbi:MAG: ATP-binding protein [Terracidiphilus sp.]|jgi:PAS domain S-box-containing protein
MKVFQLRTSADLERWPYAFRGFLGFYAAILAALLGYWIAPLRQFPMLLAFPAVILSAWFLGMWGGVHCAVTEAILLDLYLAKTDLSFPNGNAREGVQVTFFLAVLIVLSWGMRRLAEQRTQLKTQELHERLALSEVEHKMADERARISEELRERDELLKIALEVNGVAMWVWDLLENAVYGSDPICAITGREPGSINRLPKDWWRLIHLEDVESVKNALSATRETGSDYHQQFRVLWPDGTVRWMESQGKCQHDSRGRATRVVGILADVTNRKLTEEVMLRTEKLAVAGRMAASVAHEINNPLEAVGNLLYLISTAKSAKDARSQGRQALDELMRVSLITQQTLQFHRQPGLPAVTRLSEVARTVLAQFHSKLTAIGIKAEVRAEREEGVRCMPSEMHQVFANLISNLIDAMPRGGRLVIRLRPCSDWRNTGKKGMRVTFYDSGTGMNRATMRRIFEPFFTTKQETGTGLGLWVVAQLVERQHGQVRVWSWQRAAGSGTAFSVFLPF